MNTLSFVIFRLVKLKVICVLDFNIGVVGEIYALEQIKFFWFLFFKLESVYVGRVSDVVEAIQRLDD